MSFFKSLISVAAPVIGTAIGGPAGGAAGSAIAGGLFGGGKDSQATIGQVTGFDSWPQAVKDAWLKVIVPKAISATTDQPFIPFPTKRPDGTDPVYGDSFVNKNLQLIQQGADKKYFDSLLPPAQPAADSPSPNMGSPAAGRMAAANYNPSMRSTDPQLAALLETAQRGGQNNQAIGDYLNAPQEDSRVGTSPAYLKALGLINQMRAG